MIKKGKILKVKYGYNPNSSSIGSETTGAVANFLKSASANATSTTTQVIEATTKATPQVAGATEKAVQAANAAVGTTNTMVQTGLVQWLKYMALVAIGAVVIIFVAWKFYTKIMLNKGRIRKR